MKERIYAGEETILNHQKYVNCSISCTAFRNTTLTVAISLSIKSFFQSLNLLHKRRDSSVGIVLGYGLDDQGSRFDSWQGLGIFFLTTVFRMALGPTQPPIQWVPGTLSLGIKWPGHEADHSPPSSVEVKECM
jgi:hypothetical protein